MEVRHEGKKVWLHKIPERLVEGRAKPIWSGASVAVHAKNGKAHLIVLKRLNKGFSLEGVQGGIHKKAMKVEREREDTVVVPNNFL